MNANYLYFYLTGFLTSLFGVLYFLTLSKLKTKQKENSTLISENQDLRLFKEKRKSKTRMAVLNWPGWYQEKDPKVKWSVVFNLKEIARSESDPDLFQFEVVSIISGWDKDTWKLKEYSDYFMRNLNGGWINLKNLGSKNFHWVVTDSKESLRDDKLEELGI